MVIPEIEDGIIEIKQVSRVPGDRSKIVVYSSDMRIDALEAKNRILLKFLNTSWTDVLKDTSQKITVQEAIDAHFTEDEAEIPFDAENGEYWYKKGFMD